MSENVPSNGREGLRGWDAELQPDGKGYIVTLLGICLGYFGKKSPLGAKVHEALAAAPQLEGRKRIKPENLKWLLDASKQVLKELGQQEHLDSDTFLWLRRAVAYAERDLGPRADETPGPNSR